jgi:hypothetical protein
MPAYPSRSGRPPTFIYSLTPFGLPDQLVMAPAQQLNHFFPGRQALW